MPSPQRHRNGDQIDSFAHIRRSHQGLCHRHIAQKRLEELRHHSLVQELVSTSKRSSSPNQRVVSGGIYLFPNWQVGETERLGNSHGESVLQDERRSPLRKYANRGPAESPVFRLNFPTRSLYEYVAVVIRRRLTLCKDLESTQFKSYGGGGECFLAATSTLYPKN